MLIKIAYYNKAKHIGMRFLLLRYSLTLDGRPKCLHWKTGKASLQLSSVKRKGNSAIRIPVQRRLRLITTKNQFFVSGLVTYNKFFLLYF